MVEKINIDNMKVTSESVIRAISENNVDQYVEILKSEWFNEYLEYKYDPTSKDESVKGRLLNDRNRYVVMEDGKIIGGIAYRDSGDRKSIELCYFVVPAYQGKGYAKKIISGVINEIKRQLKNEVSTFVVEIMNINEKSIRAVVGIGFVIDREVRDGISRYIYKA